jgi:type II secretory pathway pseudopilin PulG
MSSFKASRASRRRNAGGEVRNRQRRGITLVEILVSVILIAVALGGALNSAGAVATQMGGGIRHTVAASMAQTRLDSLASLSCAQLPGGLYGSATTRGVKEEWAVVDGRNIKTLTVTLTIPRRTQKPAYTTVIPCRD